MPVPPSTPFTFGVALTPRGNARDWGRIEHLLHLTLTSALAQTDPDLRILIAAHDRPQLRVRDTRITFVDVDWPVERPGPHNDDSGRKKHLLNDRVLDEGGGLFMLLDADDWVDRRLVEAARAGLSEAHVGGIVAQGCAVDFGARKAAWLPDARIFDGGVDRLCGSTTVAWLRPDDPDPLRRDPFSTLRSHHQWREVAAEHGLQLASLDAAAAYLVNTAENHSDLHGPHAEWRRGFIAAVNRHGAPLDAAFVSRFGLTLDTLNPPDAT